MRVTAPAHLLRRWPCRPARTLFQREQRDPQETDGIITAFRDGEVTLRSNRRVEGFTNAVQEIGYQGVRRGDLVIHSMDGFAGAIGVSDADGKASPVVHCYRPAPEADPRYYAYLLRDLAVRGFIQSLARGIRERSTAFDSETFRSLGLPCPPLPTQRAIADYLDTETARIDALVAKKRRMIDLLDERRWTAARTEVEQVAHELVPMRRTFVDITDGPFGSAFTSDEYSDEGVIVIRLGNIGFAEFRNSDLAHLPADRFDEFRRYSVEKGDLLMAALGDPRNHAGRACISPDLGRAIVKGKCFRARVNTRIADAEYLAIYCSSPQGAEAMTLEARGSTRMMINLEIVCATRIPLPDVESQRLIVRRVRTTWSRLDRLTASLESQIDLLHEHRQALITAAVTGEVEIPGVAA